MKQLTPEEIQRMQARYELIDLGYLILRQAAYFQRRAIERGDHQAMIQIYHTLMHTSTSVSQCWTDIQKILAPSAPVAESAPEVDQAAPKETVQ